MRNGVLLCELFLKPPAPRKAMNFFEACFPFLLVSVLGHVLAGIQSYMYVTLLDYALDEDETLWCAMGAQDLLLMAHCIIFCGGLNFFQTHSTSTLLMHLAYPLARFELQARLRTHDRRQLAGELTWVTVNMQVGLLMAWHLWRKWLAG